MSISPSPELGVSDQPSLAERFVLDEVVRDHVDALYRLAYAVVGSKALAEDVAQDAIVRTWRTFPAFKGESKLRTYVFQMAYQAAVAIESGRTELEQVDLVVDSSLAPEAKNELDRALGNLDTLSRVVVVLCEIEGFSCEEAALVLSVPTPTVEARLLRSRRALALALNLLD